MHAGTVGSEVVQAGPDLVPLGTVAASASEAAIDAVRGDDVVQTLLVPVQVVPGTEAYPARASMDIADVRFGVTLTVLSVRTLVGDALVDVGGPTSGLTDFCKRYRNSRCRTPVIVGGLNPEQCCPSL